MLSRTNLALTYPEPVVDTFNIGVLHTALGGMGGHENYAPCSLDDLVNKGYDYWALGHVHRAVVLNERPHIVFPGNLQGRHIRETGAKGAALVTVEHGEIVEVTSVHCDVVRWAVLPVDLENIASFGDALDRVREAIRRAVVTSADGRLLACRVELQGRTQFHEQLFSDRDRLLAELRSSALSLGGEIAWVEKVILSTESTIAPKILADRDDAVAELQRMLEEAGSDSELLNDFKTKIGSMVSQLPFESRDDVDDVALRAAIDRDYAALIAEVTPYLSARLMAEEG